uniref:Uncharacterized protein n=1 Tax=Arundo donax TaxID=35708 RepID=A0A0A9G6E7_ARUDO
MPVLISQLQVESSAWCSPSAIRVFNYKLLLCELQSCNCSDTTRKARGLKEPKASSTLSTCKQSE